MQYSDNTTTTDPGQTASGITPVQPTNAQAAQSTGAATMPGLQEVRQQVAALRQTLHTLMADAQYADGEIVSASAVLDTQLEDYYRMVIDKKQPSLRTF